MKLSKLIFEKVLIFILVILIITLVVNIPSDLNFQREGGRLISNMNYSQYREDVVSTLYLIFSLKIFNIEIFGKSKTVGSLALSKFKMTGLILFPSLILTIILGLTIGIIGSRRKRLKNTKVILSLVPLSIPDVLIISLIQMFGFYLYSNNIKFLGLGPIEHLGSKSILQIIYPILSISIIPSFYLGNIVNLSLREEYKKDYIITARGKGLSEFEIVVFHALRNIAKDIVGSIISIISIIFPSIFIAERIFYYEGMTMELINLYTRPSSDGTTIYGVVGILFILAVFYFIVNMFMDILDYKLSN